MSQDIGPDKPLVLARIGKTHGVKGWLKVNSFTSPPGNLPAFRHFTARRHDRWLNLEMDDHREHSDTLLGHFKGYDNPESARELTGLELVVASDTLPALAQGEYYWHQLLDLEVVNVHGQLLGKVKRLVETGANDVLVVAPTDDSIDERERLIPYRMQQVVRKVDLENSRITVDWETDYLS